MNMSAENIAISNVITFSFIMGKNKRAGLHFLFKTIYSCTFIPVAAQYIVIADNKFYRQVFKIISPPQKHIHLFISMTMKKITYDDEIVWFEELHLRC